MKEKISSENFEDLTDIVEVEYSPTINEDLWFSILGEFFTISSADYTKPATKKQRLHRGKRLNTLLLEIITICNNSTVERVHPIKAYRELLAGLQLLYEETIHHRGAEQALKCLTVYSYKQLRAMNRTFGSPSSIHSPEGFEKTYLQLREGALIGHFSCHINVYQIASEAMLSPTWNYEKVRAMWIEIIEGIIRELEPIPLPPTQGGSLAA